MFEFFNIGDEVCSVDDHDQLGVVVGFGVVFNPNEEKQEFVYLVQLAKTERIRSYEFDELEKR